MGDRRSVFSLVRDGYLVSPARFASVEEALEDALGHVGGAQPGSSGGDTPGAGVPTLSVLASYAMPTREAPGRGFQALHLDFGIPLGLVGAVDVARYTLLFVDPSAHGSGAVTRLVPLRTLAPQRPWPPVSVLASRLQNGNGVQEPTEGVLARVIELADGTQDLPSKSAPDFLCGLEFASLDDEYAFFARHHVDLLSVETHVVLEPGAALLFDNLSLAHGRIGRRAIEELHQVCLGYRQVDVPMQMQVLHATLRQLTAQ